MADSTDMSLGKLREAWRAEIHGVRKESDTTELN